MLFNTENVNILGIKKGDIVEITKFGEYDGNTEYCVKIKAPVVQVSGRWFRVFVKCRLGGYFTCINFVDTYMGGKKLCYRVIGKVRDEK